MPPAHETWPYNILRRLDQGQLRARRQFGQAVLPVLLRNIYLLGAPPSLAIQILGKSPVGISAKRLPLISRCQIAKQYVQALDIRHEQIDVEVDAGAATGKQ